MKVGDWVVIAAGRRSGESGVITWLGIDGSCGCRSAIVRLRQGEWFGKQSEVRAAPYATGGLVAPVGEILVGESGPERVEGPA